MFCQQIKELRKARGLTQVELANDLGVTKQSVSNWENDNILPSMGHAGADCAVFFGDH